MNECPHCGHKFSESKVPQACPACGMKVNLVAHSQSPNLIQGYFSTLWQIMTRPSEFFGRMPLQGGLAKPLAFALVTHWIGAALAYLWHLLIGAGFADLAARFLQIAGDVADVDSPGRNIPWSQVMEARERVMHWFWGAGAVIADPFKSLFYILFVSFFVFLGARLLVSPGRDRAPRAVNYESAVRLVSYGMSPSILAGLPLFGSALASLLTVFITIAGAREVYRVRTGRAIVIALFPNLLLLGLLMAGFFVMAVVFVKFITSFLSI